MKTKLKANQNQSDHNGFHNSIFIQKWLHQTDKCSKRPYDRPMGGLSTGDLDTTGALLNWGCQPNGLSRPLLCGVHPQHCSACIPKETGNHLEDVLTVARRLQGRNQLLYNVNMIAWNKNTCYGELSSINDYLYWILF